MEMRDPDPSATHHAPRYFDESRVRRLLDQPTAYDSQREAFRCLASGLADLPDRLILPGGDAHALGFCYAARLRPDSGPVCKFGAVAEGNTQHGLPTVHALVVCLDAVTGQPAAILDGATITELRTPAATAVAVDHLAHSHSRTVAILGLGIQGRAHLPALDRLGRFTELRLWDRDHSKALAVAARAQLAATAHAVTTIEEAVADADVVVACTTSATPLFGLSMLRAGTTVVSIGSFDAGRLEVDVDIAVGAQQVVVDHLPTALRQAGPVVAAVAARQLDPHAISEIGAVVTGQARGRQADDDIVYYNSVGIGVQDAAAAWAVVDRAAASEGRTKTSNWPE